ncbi:MAG TPA: bacterial transcriptional activator domain-containing protein [Telluria sp.]|nr:bacterial transcriptional activator domain-containing protein [Telluria sp.]
MRGRRWLPAALLAVTLGAAAQDNPAPLPQDVQQDMYMEALQSIAEGRRTDAAGTLQRLIERAPLNAGAWLELALLQCGLGNADAAERMFAVIETRFHPSPDILDIINRQRDEGCAKAPPLTSSLLALGRGTDRNVNQGASNPNYTVIKDGVPQELPLLPEFLPKADQYTVLNGEYLHEISENGTSGFVQFQGRANDHLSAYNSAALFVGLQSPYRVRRWGLRGTALTGAVSLGGKLYQRQTQVQLRVGPPLPLPDSMQFTVLGSVSHNEYLTLTNFDSNTFELRGIFSANRPAWSGMASLGVLFDNAREHRPGGDRTGFYGNLLYRHALPANLSAEVAYTLQTWRSQSAYSPGVIPQVRSQQTHVLRASLTWPLTRNQQLQLEARAVRDHENISIFQYNNRQLQLSWQWQGP